MPNEQRRRFSRIRFSTGARFTVGDGQLACEVVDLSMKGALIGLPADHAVPAGAHCVLEVALDEGDNVIRMEGEVAHAEEGRIGVVWREIDLDSITHLRRLLELNLGDADLLNREFSALISD
jgi:hypothetical protein